MKKNCFKKLTSYRYHLLPIVCCAIGFAEITRANRRHAFRVIDSYIYFGRQCSLSRFPSHRSEAGSSFCSGRKNTRGKVPRVRSRWKEFQLLPEAHRNSLYLEKREINLRIKNTTSKFRELQTEVNRANNAKANEVFRYPTELSIEIIDRNVAGSIGKIVYILSDMFCY